jgi:hypothetical protein
MSSRTSGASVGIYHLMRRAGSARPQIAEDPAEPYFVPDEVHTMPDEVHTMPDEVHMVRADVAHGAGRSCSWCRTTPHLVPHDPAYGAGGHHT